MFGRAQALPGPTVATPVRIRNRYNIRESVDSLCRDGADRTRPFSKIEWLRTPKRGSYKPF